MNNAEQFQSHNYDLLLLLLIINNYLLKLIIRNQGNNEACMTRASLSLRILNPKLTILQQLY